MLIGGFWVPNISAVNYRAIEPLREMERLGHEIVWPDRWGAPDVGRLTSCDVVHVFRRHDERSRRLIADLARAGIGVVYDNDDDFTAAPPEHPHYDRLGGAKGRKLFAETVTAARSACLMTTPSEVLAAKYREAGVGEAEVVPNYLLRGAVRRPRRHSNLVIGWVAGMEHLTEVRRLPIVEALQAVIERHAHVRVETIGVDLALPERYRHDAFVQFSDLSDRVATFDIGIAPLADIPFNHARSDIKVKEYAAAGVPWLASPVGPYRGLGEAQGGRLVDDDGWIEALERLIAARRDRRRLGRAGRAWAKTQTMDRAAIGWEAVFEAAASQLVASA